MTRRLAHGLGRRPTTAPRWPRHAAAALTAAAAFGLAGCALPPVSSPAGAPVTYDCEDGLRLTVAYGADVAQVSLPDGRTLALPQQPSGSGMRYAQGPNELRGKGSEITWAVADRIPTNCIARPR